MDKNSVFKTNVSFGLIWKFITLLFTYLTVPILLKYLGVEYYGVWVTIFTILNAAYFMDLGISLGVKNKLTTALAKDDLKAARVYISTGYFSIAFIAGIALVSGLCFILVFNMQNIFNTNISEAELKFTLVISVVLVAISIVLNIYKSLLHAFQKSSKVELAMAIYQGLIYLQILFLPKIIDQPLIIIGLLYGVSNILIALVFSVLFFKKNKQIIPSFIYFKKDTIKEILGLGVGFFIIQIALIIILTTDNIIITYLIGPEATASYSIVNKLFQPFIIISTFIFTPLWTLYTNAYCNKDFTWIRNTLTRLNQLYLVLIFLIILLFFNFDWVIKFWISEPLAYSDVLILGMALFVLIKIYGDIYLTFLNGIGVIKLQMWLFVLAALINIPLSVLLVKYFNLGTSGVIFATCISLLILTITMPIQAYLILKNKK
jgi:O-antigen/teichoic acid export membrane protein